ncbi:hypothetical protein BH23PAT2_BH23PAT2_09210 [soil metagenome]
MRKPATMLGSLVIATFILMNTGQSASAETGQQPTDNKTVTALRTRLEPSEAQNDMPENIMLVRVDETETVDEDDKKDEPVIHAIASGESLSIIAKVHNTTWKRIWNKNDKLAHPDIILVGNKLVIPDTDEKLEERALPEPPVIQQSAQPAATPARQAAPQRISIDTTTAPRQQVQRATPAPQVAPRGSSSGNTYARGYCTWYAKNRRPDLPNNLGNANTWAQRARAQGMSVSSTPRVGAIATATGGSLGHVAYVERVNNNGTVTVSEMNWKGLYVISTRATSASDFTYIN